MGSTGVESGTIPMFPAMVGKNSNLLKGPGHLIRGRKITCSGDLILVSDHGPGELPCWSFPSPSAGWRDSQPHPGRDGVQGVRGLGL